MLNSLTYLLLTEITTKVVQAHGRFLRCAKRAVLNIFTFALHFNADQPSDPFIFHFPGRRWRENRSFTSGRGSPPDPSPLPDHAGTLIWLWVAMRICIAQRLCGFLLFQFVQQLGMTVQQAEEVDNSGNWSGFTSFVA